MAEECRGIAVAERVQRRARGCHGSVARAFLVGILWRQPQRQQRLRQAVQVPECHLRLLAVGVAALRVGVVADMVGVERVEEAKWAVVDGQAQDRHIVGVHHAVAEADGLPVRDQVGGAQRDLAQQRLVGLGVVAARGHEVVDDEIRQLAQRGDVVVRGEMLEVPEADKGRRQPGHHRGGFDGLAPHRRVRAHDRQRARGRHAQCGHGFGAEVLADRRAQHRAAIGHARVGRQARALELDFPRAGGGLGLRQADGAAVAELASPDPELVPGIDRGERVGPVRHLVADKGLDEVLLAADAGIPAEQGRSGRRHPHQVGRWQRRRAQPREELRAEFGKAGRGAPGRGQRCRRGCVGGLRSL
ncbi:hypothetical protein D3C72_1280830 [compost metagenome]